MTKRSPFGLLADRLKDDWTLKARPEQLPPEGQWLIWLLMAGRGFGKTRTGAETTRVMVESGAARRIALIAPTTADVRKVMVEGPSGLLAVSPAWNRPTYEPSNREVRWPNGAVAITYSSEEPERLRGPEHDFIWADEVGAWANQRETWDQAQFGLRVGPRPKIMVTTTPRPTPLLRELVKRAADGSGEVAITRGSTAENEVNLPTSFLKELYGRYGGTRLGRQELNAELLEDVQGALWTRKLLDDTRHTGEMPSFRRIVIAIDPAVSVGENSDETGLVAAGIDHAGHVYIIEDSSGRYGPTEWARRAVAMYHRMHADRIVAERNQGGAMVEGTIRQVDGNVPIKTIHASRGKVARAEPVSALWEQGRAHIIGTMEQLEDQLCSFAPGSSKSPDRLDAMVYAALELTDSSGNDGMIGYYEMLANGLDTSPRPQGSPTAGDKLRCYGPAGATLQLITGRTLQVGADGSIDLTEEEAGPIRPLMGWTVPPPLVSKGPRHG